MHKVLVVEDQVDLAESLKQALSETGYFVEVCFDGRSGLDKARSGAYDLIILDLMLPILNGFEVIRKCREEGIQASILVLTAKDAVDDRVRGLDLGADDYLVKPFRLEELLARVRVQVRRSGDHAQVLSCGDLMMDLSQRKVKRGTKTIYLSRTEFAFLEMLLRRKGEPVSKQQLLKEIWEDDEMRDDNIVEVYASYLRQKLETGGVPRLIHTVRGKGYAISESDA